jgi:hypothetical protein
MKLDELKELAKSGKLKLNKSHYRTVYRDKGWRGQKWDDTTQASWDTTQIAYKIIYYSCRTADMLETASYKITKRDYNELLSLGAKEVSA